MPLVSQKSKYHGISLVECLVLIAIGAALALIAHPIYQLGRAEAQRAGCVAHLRQIGVGLHAYAAENRWFLPPTTRTYDPPLDGRYERLFWPALVAPYLKLGYSNQPGQIALRCPARSTFSPAEGRNYTYGISLGKASHTDSVINGQLIPGNYYTQGYVLPISRLGAGTFIVADCNGRNRPQISWPGTKGSWPLTEERGGTGRPDSNGAVSEDYNGVEFTHRGRANFLRADGSVVSLTVRQWAENESNIWGDNGQR